MREVVPARRIGRARARVPRWWPRRGCRADHPPTCPSLGRGGRGRSRVRSPPRWTGPAPRRCRGGAPARRSPGGRCRAGPSARGKHPRSTGRCRPGRSRRSRARWRSTSLDEERVPVGLAVHRMRETDPASSRSLTGGGFQEREDPGVVEAGQLDPRHAGLAAQRRERVEQRMRLGQLVVAVGAHHQHAASTCRPRRDGAAAAGWPCRPSADRRGPARPAPGATRRPSSPTTAANSRNRSVSASVAFDGGRSGIRLANAGTRPGQLRAVRGDVRDELVLGGMGHVMRRAPPRTSWYGVARSSSQCPNNTHGARVERRSRASATRVVLPNPASPETSNTSRPSPLRDALERVGDRRLFRLASDDTERVAEPRTPDRPGNGTASRPTRRLSGSQSTRTSRPGPADPSTRAHPAACNVLGTRDPPSNRTTSADRGSGRSHTSAHNRAASTTGSPK